MNALRQLPSVNALLDASFGRTLIERHGRALVLFAVKTVLEEERQTGAVHDDPERWRRVDDAIRRLREPRLQPCINATGVILHTNLGRAPLAARGRRRRRRGCPRLLDAGG